MKEGKKGSVKPCDTQETFRKIKYPGAADIASPSAKDKHYDLNENVDGKADSMIRDNGTTQMGGHNKKR